METPNQFSKGNDTTDKAVKRDWENRLADLRDKAYLVEGFCNAIDKLYDDLGTTKTQESLFAILTVLPKLSSEVSLGLDQYLTDIPNDLLREKI